MSRFKYLFILCLFSLSCSEGGPKTAYLQAEQLWDDGKFQESLVAFDQIASRDLDEGLSDLARFRAAQVSLMNLKDFVDARKRLEMYVMQGKSAERRNQADSALGAVLFDSLSDFPAYLRWIDRVEQNRPFIVTPEQRLKKGLAFMYLRNFDSAYHEFARLEREHSASHWATEAAYRMAENQMLGAKNAGDTQKALQGFKRVLSMPGGHAREMDIQVNSAICQEDLGQWQEAKAEWQRIEKLGGRTVGTAKVHLLRIEQRLNRQGAYANQKK